jgi:hypothetical protein
MEGVFWTRAVANGAMKTNNAISKNRVFLKWQATHSGKF